MGVAVTLIIYVSVLSDWTTEKELKVFLVKREGSWERNLRAGMVMDE